MLRRIDGEKRRAKRTVLYPLCVFLLYYTRVLFRFSNKENAMYKFLILVAVSSTCYAQDFSTQLFDRTLYNDGTTSQRIGNTTIYYDALGNEVGSRERYGNRSFYSNGINSERYGANTLYYRGFTPLGRTTDLPSGRYMYNPNYGLMYQQRYGSNRYYNVSPGLRPQRR